MTDAAVDDHASSDVHGDRAVIMLGARLDALEAQQLRIMLDDLLQSGVRHLLVDLSKAQFIDSAGLACLIRAMTLLARVQGEIELVRPESEDAWRVFRLTKFDEVFRVHTTLPTAAETTP